MIQGKHSVVNESVLSSLHYELLSGSLRHLMNNYAMILEYEIAHTAMLL